MILPVALPHKQTKIQPLIILPGDGNGKKISVTDGEGCKIKVAVKKGSTFPLLILMFGRKDVLNEIW